MKDVEKRLKEESKHILPDDDLQIKVLEQVFAYKAEDKIAQDEEAGVNSNAADSFRTAKEWNLQTDKSKNVSSKRRAKGFWISFASAIATVCIVLVIVFTTGVIDFEKAEAPITPGTGEKVHISESVKQTYAMGAFSSGLMLSEFDAGAVSAALTPENIEEIEHYMSIADSYMSADIKTTVEELSDGDYRYKMTVTQSTVGGSKSAVIYYNETAVKQTDGEVTSTFKGFIEMDGNRYRVDGKREKEVENNEAEYEVKMTIFYSADSYVVFEQEIEHENGETETEYEYKIVRNNYVVEEFEISIENEKDERSVEIKSYKDGVETEFSYELDTQGHNSYYKIKFFKQGFIREEIIYAAHLEDGGYRFFYKD